MGAGPRALSGNRWLEAPAGAVCPAAVPGRGISKAFPVRMRAAEAGEKPGLPFRGEAR